MHINRLACTTNNNRWWLVAAIAAIVIGGTFHPNAVAAVGDGPEPATNQQRGLDVAIVVGIPAQAGDITATAMRRIGADVFGALEPGDKFTIAAARGSGRPIEILSIIRRDDHGHRPAFAEPEHADLADRLRLAGRGERVRRTQRDERRHIGRRNRFEWESLPQRTHRLDGPVRRFRERACVRQGIDAPITVPGVGRGHVKRPQQVAQRVNHRTYVGGMHGESFRV